MSDVLLGSLLERANLAELFEELCPETTLHRSGRGFKSLCPWHDDRATPSLWIDPERGWFWCFGAGCGARGNAINLVQRTQGLSYFDSIKWLADKYGVALDESFMTKVKITTRKSEIYQIAWKLFKLYASEPDNPNMRTWNEIKQFASWKLLPIGAYPPEIERFEIDLIDAGLNEEESLHSGLLPAKDKDQKKELRKLGIMSAPKYSNHCIVYPYHSYFDRITKFKVRDVTKSTEHREAFISCSSDAKGVYGLDLLDPETNPERVLLVEGETDLCAIQDLSYRDTRKFHNVLACSGGNASIEILKNLGIGNIWAMFDHDEAGITYTKNLVRDVNRRLDMGVVAVDFPDPHKDPYDYVKSLTTWEQFTNTIEKNRPYKYIAKRLLIDRAAVYSGPPEEKIAWLRRQAMKFGIEFIQNEMEWDDYIAILAEHLHCTPDSLRKELLSTRLTMETDRDFPLKLKGKALYTVDGEGNEQMLSNFHIILSEDRKLIEDDGAQIRREFSGKLICEGLGYDPDILIDSEKWGSDAGLTTTIYNTGGPSMIFSKAGAAIDLIRRAATIYSTDMVRKESLTFLGYLDVEGGKTIFVNPKTVISKDEVVENKEYPIYMDGEDPKGRHIRLEKMDPDMEPQLYDHILKELFHFAPLEITVPYFAFIHAPALHPFIREMAQRFTLNLIGQSGGGKSTLSLAMQSFWGADFFQKRNNPNWGSTPNSIQRCGHDFRNALMLVDDFKPSRVKMSSLPELKELLQSYADFSGRGRLNRNAEAIRTYYVRGWMHSNGEDLPESEASVIGRMLVLNWDGVDKNVDIFNRIGEMHRFYSMHTSAYIRWLLNQNSADITAKWMEMREWFYAMFMKEGDNISRRTGNDMRISTNLAYLWTCGWTSFNYMMQRNVMSPQKCQEYLTFLRDVCVVLRQRMMGFVKDEEIEKRATDIMREIIITGRCAVLKEPELGWTDENYALALNDLHGRKVIGITFNSDPAFMYIYPEVAWAEIQSIAGMQNTRIAASKRALGEQLIKDGIIIPAKDSSSSRTPAELGGRRSRCWKVRAESLGLGELLKLPSEPKDEVTDSPLITVPSEKEIPF